MKRLGLVTQQSHVFNTVFLYLQFPAQSTAASDEQKVFGLWETGEDFDKVNTRVKSQNKKLKTQVSSQGISHEPPYRYSNRLLNASCEICGFIGNSVFTVLFALVLCVTSLAAPATVV